MDVAKTLVVIPARKGSKGVPNKNKRPLAGKPLVQYTIEVALTCFPKENICVSTDDEDIIANAKSCGLDVPFVRPKILATDAATTHDVLLHAIDFYEKNSRKFEYLILLQPTSPLRNAKHIEEAMQLLTEEVDLVVSVTQAKENPYFNLMEENKGGFLEKSKVSTANRRQDVPKVYTLNGAIYITRIAEIRKTELGKMKRILKYEMDAKSSLDIDTEEDWEYAEFVVGSK